MTHVMCKLTAKNQDQLRNPMLGNRVWATFFLLLHATAATNQYLIPARPTAANPPHAAAGAKVLQWAKERQKDGQRDEQCTVS